MPKIPTYMASLDYRPARGDVEGAGASGRMLAQFGEAAADLPAAFSNMAARSSAAGGAFGGQIAGQVKKSEDAARNAAQADIARRTEQAQAEAERADGTARAMTALRQTIDGFGADSDPASMMDRYLEQAGGIAQDILSGIRNPQARAQVEADYQKLFGVQTSLLRAESLRRLAEQGRAALHDNLALYAGMAATARHPLEQDDAVDLAVREIQGKARAGFITTEDADRIERRFYGDLAERQARLAIAADPQAALAGLQRADDFAALAPERRARLVAEADRAVRAQSVRQQTETAALRRETAVRLARYVDGLRDGEAPDDERFSRESLTATLGADEGAKRWAEIEEARAFGGAVGLVKWATPSEIADLSARADSSVAARTPPSVAGSREGSPNESPGATLLQRAVDRRDEQLWSAPADYVLSNPRVAELHAALAQATAQPKLPPAGLPTGEDRRAAIAAYANATLAEQERLGVPADHRQVLPEAMARELAAGILAGDPHSADRTLRDLAADWGEAWPQVLADLSAGGLSPAYAELAGMKNPVARQTLAEVLASQAKEPGTLRAKAGNDAAPIDDLVHHYRDDGLLSDDRVKLVKLLAYRYAQTAEPEEAVRRAVSDITGDIVLTAGSEERSEADDIADAWRAVGAKLRHGRPLGEGTSIFDYIVDIEKGAIGGARDAAQETLEAIDSLAELLGEHPELGRRLRLPDGLQAQTTGGEIAHSVSQFLVGFFPAFKAVKFASGGAALTKAGKFAQMEGAAAAASATVLDPLEARLSNQWQELGLPQNILTDYLAASPDDTKAEGRLKNAIESLAIAPALVTGLFLSTKILRSAKRALKSGEETALDGLPAELRKNADELKALDKPEASLATMPGGISSQIPKALQGAERYEKLGAQEYVRFTTGLNAGAISDAIASAANIKAGPIRLRKGFHDSETDLGIGEIHIQQGHGQHIKGDVADFVADVSASFNEIRRGNSDRIILIRRDKAKNRKKNYQDVLIVELQPTKSGGYEVITAGAFKNNYLNNRELLWSREHHALTSPTGQATPSSSLLLPGYESQESGEAKSSSAWDQSDE